MQLLPGDLAIAAAEGHQMEADVSLGDSLSLVVWSDYRSTPDATPPFATEGTGSDIYGRLLDASGQAINTTPFVINQDFGDQDQPTASWNGESWLVVWKTETVTSPTYEKILGTRVAADGTILDAIPIEIHNNQSYYENFEPYQIASDGQGWVVVFQPNGPQQGVFATRVAADGSLPSASPVQIHSTPFATTFDIAFAQNEYLVTWDDPFSIPRGRLYSSDLQPITTFTLPGAENVASDGTDFLVTWTAPGPGAWFTHKGMIVTADGSQPSPQGFSIDARPNFCCTETVWDGSHYWATWGGLTAARITPNGTVVDPGGLDIGSVGQFSVPYDLDAAPGGGLHIVWNDGDNAALDPKDVYTTSVSPNGQVNSEVLVSSGAPSQLNSDFAAGPNMFAVAFESRVSDATTVKVQRLDAFGTPLDNEPIAIASGPNVSSPAVAFDGSRYMITWQDDLSAFGQLMGIDGTLIGAPIEIMTTWDAPDVAGLDGTFLVVATDYLSNDNNSRVAFTQRIDGASGVLLDAAPQELGNFVIFSRAPHVVTFGGRWLVTWQTNLSHNSTIAGTKAAFVEQDGTSPGPFSVGLGWAPDVAVSGDRALFVAVSETVASANTDLEGRLMLADGSFVGAPFTISDAADKQLNPTATFDGEHFQVAWEDKREAVVHFDERTQIYGTRVTSGGQVLDMDGNGKGGRPLTAGASATNDPAYVSSGSTTLLAASTFTSQPEYGAYRIGISQVQVTIEGDFDGDLQVDATDIDMLCAAWSDGDNQATFDLTGDDVVDVRDMDALVLDILSTAYGDANLDGLVDGQDFLAWNANKFQPGGWGAGDFSCDGEVDGNDFIIWNANKFQVPAQLENGPVRESKMASHGREPHSFPPPAPFDKLANAVAVHQTKSTSDRDRMAFGADIGSPRLGEQHESSLFSLPPTLIQFRPSEISEFSREDE